MDLRQLRYFVAIVESGSISRAALQLNVAQPALSLHIRNMEADLGVPLLFRTAQGVQPTEAGRILLRNARLIIDQFDAAQQEIRGSGGEPGGPVRLGLPSTLSQVLGVPLILAARRLYPKIVLRIAEGMSGHVLEWLREGRIDLGLLYRAVDDRGLVSTALLSEALFLVGPALPPPHLCPPEAGSLSDEAALSLPLLLPSPGHGLRDLIDERAAARGLRLTVALEVDAPGALKALVEEGVGYSILPAHAVLREQAEGRLRAWAITPTVTRVVHLARPADRPLPVAITAIEQLCRTTVTDLVRTKAWDVDTDPAAIVLSNAVRPARLPVARHRH